jgi:hypothetical protein
MKRLAPSILMFFLLIPCSLLKGECKYYRITWTEVIINAPCYIESDGGGLEDPTINVYCLDGNTLQYSSEWEINIPNTGTYPIPPANWNFCADNNEFLFGPVPEGTASIDFFLELFESDDNNCTDHADGSDDCITTGIGTLDLTLGAGQLGINGNADVYFKFDLEEVGEVIEGINVGIPECLPNNSYDIEIEVSYNFSNFCSLFPDSSPDLIVNGNTFAITGSPQTITLSNLPSDENSVDIAVSLSGNGCEKIFYDAFNAPEIPSAIITAPDGYIVNCYINSISLDGAGSSGDLPLAYNWSTSETNSSIIPTNPGNYQLTVTSNSGCTAVADVDVEVDLTFPEAIIISDQDTINCNFPQVILDGSASSGNGILTYQWNNGYWTSDNTIDYPGFYTLTVTDLGNGCTNTAEIMIWEDIQEPLISLDLPDGDSINCNQTDLDILSNTMDMSLTYSWNTGDTVQNINVTSPGMYQVTVSSNNGCTNSAETVIFADTNIPDLIFQLPQGNILNCDNSDLTIDALPSTGDGSLIFNWENGAIDASINVDQPGYYALTITDAKGCSVIDSIEIVDDLSIPEIIFATPSGDTLDCYQTMIILDASLSLGDSSLSFEWSSGQDQNTINISSAGTYYLTITQANGCSDVDSFEIYENLAIPVIEIDFPNGQILNCIQSVVIIDANNSIGSSSLDFQWSTGDSTEIVEILTEGLFSLTVTDENGCSSIENIEVLANLTAPEIEFSLPEGDTLSCGKTNVTVDAGASLGDSSSVFNWSTGIDQNEILVTTPGTYFLTITQANGCIDIDSIVIYENIETPTLLFDFPGGNIVDCGNSSVLISASNSFGQGILDYSWSTGEISNEINLSDPGTYYLSITDTNGCSTVDSFLIESNSSLPVININFPNGDTLNCKETILLIDASLTQGEGQLSFLWNTGETTEEIMVVDPVSYSLTVTDINGCTSSTIFEIIEDIMNPEANIDAPLGTTINCNLDAVILDGSLSQGAGQLSFLWNTGETTEVIMAVDPVLYSLTVTDINGCTSSAMFEIIEDIINPEAIIDTPLGATLNCDLDLIILDASLSQSQGTLEYSWSLTSSDATETVSSPGIFSVTITDINGCTDTESVEIVQIDDLVVEYQTESPSCKDGFDGKIIISEISGGNPPYFYQLDSNPLVELTNTPIVIQNLGNPEYNLTITDINNCIFEATAIIPEGSESCVELGEDITIDQGTSATIQVNTNISNPDISWSPSGLIQETGILEFLLSPEISTTYIIEVTDENGCLATDQITVFVKASKNKIYLPNVFSPSSNIDENRVFTFLGNFDNIKTVHTFSIYNRWGNKMYDVTNSTYFNEIGWDGLVDDQRATSGIYVYHIVVEYEDGMKENLVGDFLLLR